MHMKLISRPLYLSRLNDLIDTPDIKIITGIRRSGKSKLLDAFAKHILSVDPTANIISIDLTKIRYEGLKDYHALNDYIEQNYRDGIKNYLMIDEVQLCANFELTIISLHSEETYDIYLTGSNAFLLSSDLATLFTGRCLEIHIYPFSFAEYCTYFDVKDDYDNQFDRYVRMGGLAGSYPYKNDSDKSKYIREVYETILIRDLVDKYRLGSR